MDGPCVDELEWSGAWGTVTFAQWSGREKSVNEWKATDDEVHGSLKSRFERLAADGYLPSPMHAEPLGPGILEIKVKGKGRRGHYRAGAFQLNRSWLISHFFKSKHNRKYAAQQRKVVEQAKEEHQRWLAEQEAGEHDNGQSYQTRRRKRR